jgi:MFS superfamily sulfate permease-like transporter
VTAPGEPRRDGDRLLMRQFGGRTPLSVLANAAALAIAGPVLFPLLGQIPRVALSAVIMVIAVQHFDVWSLELARGLRRARGAYRLNAALDLAVVAVVAVLSIAIHIVLAVFIGVAIAVPLFVFRMSRSIVRRPLRHDPFADVAASARPGIPRKFGRRHSCDGARRGAVFWHRREDAGRGRDSS